MIIIRMSGGLERQMFQYALYLKLTSMGREVKFDDINEYRDERTQPIMLSVFDIDYPRATWEEINRYTDGATDVRHRLRRALHGRKTNIYREQGFYDPKVLEFEDVYLDGKFMSQKYFEDILPLVHQTYRFPPIGDLKLAPRSDANFLIYYNDITETDAVGIHVRRSDSRFNEELYENICTPEYYTAAIRYLLERAPDAEFYVFSNEPKWVKGWLKNIILGLIDENMSREDALSYRKRFHLVQANDEFTSYLDLFLLSKCRHHILSNSAFSWWGTWLNENPDRITIAPNMWMNGVDSEEIYTEGMVLINAKGRVERRVK